VFFVWLKNLIIIYEICNNSETAQALPQKLSSILPWLIESSYLTFQEAKKG